MIVVLELDVMDVREDNWLTQDICDWTDVNQV